MAKLHKHNIKSDSVFTTNLDLKPLPLDHPGIVQKQAEFKLLIGSSEKSPSFSERDIDLVPKKSSYGTSLQAKRVLPNTTIIERYRERQLSERYEAISVIVKTLSATLFQFLNLINKLKH